MNLVLKHFDLFHKILQESVNKVDKYVCKHEEKIIYTYLSKKG